MRWRRLVHAHPAVEAVEAEEAEAITAEGAEAIKAERAEAIKAVRVGGKAKAAGSHRRARGAV